MKKITLISLILCICINHSFAQEEKSTLLGLEISGSVDSYWKYDFQKQENINTFFTEDHNSLSLGMIDLAFRKKTGKASFLGELSFGPRGQHLSLLNADDGNSFHIQNLYIAYDISDKLSMCAGFMGTFVGYEVISPVDNFHYSTSYLFGAGPFQNAGIKAEYAFSEKLSLMVGLFNDWNVYKDSNGVSHFGSQLSVMPNDKSSFYLNFLSGTSAGGASNYSSGTLIDLVGNYKLTPQLSIGLNATNYNKKEEGGYQGVALYPQVNLSEHIAIGLRGEYFETKAEPSSSLARNKIFIATLSGQLKHHGLTLIPEIRLDSSEEMLFLKKNLEPSKNAGQFSLALVYAF